MDSCHTYNSTASTRKTMTIGHLTTRIKNSQILWKKPRQNSHSERELHKTKFYQNDFNSGIPCEQVLSIVGTASHFVNATPHAQIVHHQNRPRRRNGRDLCRNNEGQPLIAKDSCTPTDQLPPLQNGHTLQL